MPQFKVSWTRYFHEDYGYDHTVTVGSGSIAVTAPNDAHALIEARSQLNNYLGHRETLSVRDAVPFPG